MIEETSIKTHLIITDVHEEYTFNWCGKIKDARPLLTNGMPTFVVVGTDDRAELRTVNIQDVENCAKKMTRPHGRSAVTTAKAYIYIKEEDDNEMLLGTVQHNHVKTYAQMYDKVGYRL